MSKIEAVNLNQKQIHDEDTKPILAGADVNLEPKGKRRADRGIAFAVIAHSSVFGAVLKDLREVNFHRLICFESNKPLRRKHFVYGVVKKVLEIAKARGLLICVTNGIVYTYNGAFWKQCSRTELGPFLALASVKMGLKVYEARYYEFKDTLTKQFMSEAQIPPPTRDKQSILINLMTETLQFTDTGWQRRDFNPADFITYQLPFAYDPEARCPMFDAFLTRVVPDQADRELLQEFVGYIFTNLNLEKCLVLTGPGGNGKSVFMNIVCALIGPENTLRYSLGQFNSEYNRAQLVDVLLNYSSERGFDLNPDIFKALISAEPIQARTIYQSPFELHCNAKFITNCNELPHDIENTHAYFRRFIIVPFEQKISDDEKDIDLANKVIAAELPGILNWALRGVDRIVRNRKFSTTESSEKAIMNFRAQSDSVHLFVNESRYIPSQDEKVPLARLYNEYKVFCAEDGYKAKGKNKFSLSLERIGFERTRNSVGATSFLVTKTSETLVDPFQPGF